MGHRGFIPLPPSTKLSFVKWANNFYKLTYVYPLLAGLSPIEFCFRPDVQRKFMAYIADLTNVLDILFTLTSRRGQKHLNVKTIKAAVMTYHKSMRRNQIHAQVRYCSVAIFGSSGVVAEIEDLVLRRYVIDEGLMKAIGKITLEQLEGEEDWYSSK